MAPQLLKRRVTAFTGGFIQVLLVVISTTLISAHSPVWAVMLVAFGINYNWTHNSKRVALGDEWDRVLYAVGGASGAGVGYVFGGLISYCLASNIL